MTATSDRIDLRCAPWTHELGVDPVGSAVQIDRLVTVEVPLPWPADIDDLPWIAELDPPGGTRMQAIVPEVARADGRVLVNRWDRQGARFVGADWLVPAVDVPDALALVVAGGDPGDGDEAPPELLICGHGARDRCCGGSGTRLAVEVRAALPHLRIRRTSHLGGHRFAPTALDLPGGRMWAHLDADVLVDIAEQRLHPTEARDHYRGHVGLAPWAQVVEAARLSEEGWAAFDVDELDADVRVEADGSAATVALRWDGPDGPGERTERVVVRRRYPVLQCGLPPELAKKDAPEFALA
ncbi:MAG TPA: sucrase ferredoxin [Acidimicrobiales bacterium]|nr:sucrase ferredoxin [Acidimicrobiales bacterium]